MPSLPKLKKLRLDDNNIFDDLHEVNKKLADKTPELETIGLMDNPCCHLQTDVTEQEDAKK